LFTFGHRPTSWNGTPFAPYYPGITGPPSRAGGKSVMQYLDQRFRLHVEIRTKGCELPTDERERMQKLLEPLGEAVSSFAGSHLVMNFVHHPKSGKYPFES